MFLLKSDIEEIAESLGDLAWEFSGKRILITGGRGFLGRYFSDVFIYLNKNLFWDNGKPLCELIVLDNFITAGEKGKDVPISRDMAFVEHDIIKPFYPERPVDFVIHAAGIASPYYYRRYPLETLQVATTGLTNVLELAKRQPNAKLLFFSSSEIYGDPDPKRVPTAESYWGNVSSLGKRACYDDKTEILTENGWESFSKLTKEISVATLNPEGIVEYHVPTEYIEYKHKGDMVQFSSTVTDLNVTPDHNLYVKDKIGKFRFIKAGNIKYGPSWGVPTGANFTGAEKKWMEFSENPSRFRPDLKKISMDDWLEFLGYYISEGCAYTRKTKEKRSGCHFVKMSEDGKIYDVSRYYILISQVKLEGRKKISACLDRIGINYMDSDHHQFRICSKFLVNLLKPLGKAGDKYVPREYMNLSPRQSKILLDALVLGDGTVKKAKNGRKGGHIIYYTKSKKLADDVQELALRVGYAACISQSVRGLYHVNIRRPRYAKITNIKRYEYDGRVYCVNVKNHIICVRRNGKAVWCGNCYDESKRLGETLVQIFHEHYGVQGKIVRPFNCLTGDQKVLYEKDGELLFESFEKCYERTGGSPGGVTVPSFNTDGRVIMRSISAILRRKVNEEVITFHTKWGRSITVTEDHDLFRFINGEIRAVAGKDLNVGDKIVIPRSLPIPESDLLPFFISDKIPNEGLSLRSEVIREVILSRPPILRKAAGDYGVASRLFSANCLKWDSNDRIPAGIFKSASIPHVKEESVCYRSSDKFISNYISDIDSLLWLFGYTLADGHVCDSGGSYSLEYSDKHKKYLDKVARIIKELFGINSLINIDRTKTPIMIIHSRVLVELFKSFGMAGAGSSKCVPGWVLKLPKHRISKFLHGFWCGDGNHDAKTTGKFILFNNSNWGVIQGLNALLLRLGLLGSVHSFRTRAAKHKNYVTAHRIEVHGVNGTEVDKLHELSPRNGSDVHADIAFAEIKSIDRKTIDGFVYDFTVPGTENFFGGDLGIMCHNCYGPGMQKTDYRVLPNFGAKVLEKKPLQVYGTGNQTRTFCYATDAIRGFLQVLVNGVPGEPYNIGNPTPEISVLDLVKEIERALDRKIEYNVAEYPDSYPADEPNRRCPDITKAQSQIGYNPKISLREGLTRFFKWAEKAYAE